MKIIDGAITVAMIVLFSALMVGFSHAETPPPLIGYSYLAPKDSAFSGSAETSFFDFYIISCKTVNVDSFK